MENQEIERLASTLKPSGTIERGDIRSVEQRGPGVAFRSQLKGNDIIQQTVELPNLSLTFDQATTTIAVNVNGAPVTPEGREEALRVTAHFLRHIQNRDQLSQNLLRNVEKQLSAMAMDDQERTVMSNTQSGILNGNNGDATIVSQAQFAMMERTCIEQVPFNPKDLDNRKHMPLPLWSLIALAGLFLITLIVVLVKIL